MTATPYIREEFGSRPFVAQAFIGVRSWRVTASGILTGVHHCKTWVAGENVAVCDNPISNIGQALHAFLASRGQVFLKKPTSAPVKEHQIARLGCTCGFYAYFDTDHNPHHASHHALGLIEGYGAMTVGSRGFRAEKARIIGLVNPSLDVARRYQVPVYRTLDDALAEFPLSAPPG